MKNKSNKTKTLKRLVCLVLSILLRLNTFAAVISDNDGAAFVTKAEFDSLKKSFADQIVNYNESIDSKIDGAIASYLAGTAKKKESFSGFIEVKNNTEYVYGRRRDYGGITKQIWNGGMIKYITWASQNVPSHRFNQVTTKRADI